MTRDTTTPSARKISLYLRMVSESWPSRSAYCEVAYSWLWPLVAGRMEFCGGHDRQAGRLDYRPNYLSTR
jgi:hypothetical protein